MGYVFDIKMLTLGAGTVSVRSPAATAEMGCIDGLNGREHNACLLTRRGVPRRVARGCTDPDMDSIDPRADILIPPG